MPASTARAEIGALIRSDREVSERARARVLIEGSEQAGYLARIDIARGASGGERELRGARCQELAEAVVLIVAMAIDPEGAASRAAVAAPSGSTGVARAEPSPAAARTEAEPEAEREPPAAEPEPEAEQEPEEEPEAEEPEQEEEPSDPRRAGRFVLGVLASGDAGSLPNATLGGGALAGVHWQRLRVELHALAYLPQVEADGPAAGLAEISLYSAALAGCTDLLGSRDEERALGACGTLEAGLSSGEPRGISDGRSSTGLWLAGFFGLDVRQRLVGPLHLRVLAQAGVPVLRPSYEIEPFGRVYRASPVLGRFGISAFVLFP